jgi:hypothetical protein
MATSRRATPKGTAVSGSSTVTGSLAAGLPARLLDLRTASRYLGCTYWHLRRLVAAGHVPVVRMPNPRAAVERVGRRLLLDIKDLDVLIDRWKERNNADVNPAEVRRGSRT